MKVYIKGDNTVNVDNYEAASVAVRKAWGSSRSSAFYADKRAGLIESDGVVVAHVSFNGRVWLGADRFAMNAAPA